MPRKSSEKRIASRDVVIDRPMMMNRSGSRNKNYMKDTYTSEEKRKSLEKIYLNKHPRKWYFIHISYHLYPNNKNLPSTSLSDTSSPCAQPHWLISNWSINTHFWWSLSPLRETWRCISSGLDHYGREVKMILFDRVNGKTVIISQILLRFSILTMLH